MRILARLAAMLILAGAPLCLSTLSAAAPTPGRWTLRASDRPILILELRKKAGTSHAWTGALILPRHFTVDPTFTSFSNVEGPAKVEPVVATVAHAGELGLTVRDTSSSVDHLIWRPSEAGGTLEFADVSSVTMPLVRAGAEERVADAWDKDKTYTTQLQWPDNPEMTAIFDADQAARRAANIDWSVVAPQDAARRGQTKALLDAGKLRSEADFYHAAFVFQHGDKPDDYLLAHTLAVVAAADGRKDAAWIAAATLDRYLQSIGRKQIYGTQFLTPQGKPVTQEPYDRSLVSDALRRALDVPPMAEQEEQKAKFQEELDGLDKSKAITPKP